MANPKDISRARSKLLEGMGVPEEKPFISDRFQEEAIESLADGQDTLVVAPTGAGKTFVAVQAIKYVVGQGKRAVYTAPLKALSNTKYAEFKQIFEPDHSVGLLTGDRKIEGDADVVVATTEIYRNELYSFQDNYSLVVLDELHYLADPQRGAVWEESIILSSKASTLLMLSASISNPEEVADWIHEIRGREVHIVKVEKRPVALRLGFLHPEHGVVPLEGPNGEIFPVVEEFYRESHRGGQRRRGGDRRGQRGGGGRGREDRGSGGARRGRNPKKGKKD